MAVTVDDVRHIALLARLGIDDARAATLVQELNGILSHMNALQKVNTANVQAAPTGAPEKMPLRPDVLAPIALHRARADFAPQYRDGFFLVPRLSTHEEAEDDGERAP